MHIAKKTTPRSKDQIILFENINWNDHEVLPIKDIYINYY